MRPQRPPSSSFAAVALSVVFPLLMARCGEEPGNQIKSYDASLDAQRTSALVHALIAGKGVATDSFDVYFSAPAGTASLLYCEGACEPANASAYRPLNLVKNGREKAFFRSPEPLVLTGGRSFALLVRDAAGKDVTAKVVFAAKGQPQPQPLPQPVQPNPPPSSQTLADDVYLFPFEPGSRVLYGQGPDGQFSHRGQCAYDLVIGQGTAIVAARGGRVLQANGDNDDGGQANVIVVEQDNGTRGIYLHMMRGGVLVKQGDQITAGQVIGKVGNTGFSTSPHLHYQVERSDGSISPVKFATATAPSGELLMLDRSYEAPAR